MTTTITTALCFSPKQNIKRLLVRDFYRLDVLPVTHSTASKALKREK